MMRFESAGRRWSGPTAVRAHSLRRSLRRHWGWWLIGALTALFLLWLLYHRFLAPAWLLHLPPSWLATLGLVEAAAAFTLSFIWLGLWWRAYRGAALPAGTPPLSRGALYELSPSDFEKYVAGVFRQRGYDVHRRGRSGDAGVDLEVTAADGRRAIVQCKRYQNTIGPEVVRELFGTMLHEGVSHAFLVTTADISDSARAWALGKPMTLIDGATLVSITAAQQAAAPPG